jgi:hypothetical protein
MKSLQRLKARFFPSSGNLNCRCEENEENEFIALEISKIGLRMREIWVFKDH